MTKQRFFRLVLWFVVMFACLALVVGALGYYKVTQIMGFIKLAQSGAFAPPPTAVTTQVVGQSQWQPEFTAVGATAALQGVTLSNDLPGTVTGIAFESGAEVKKGDLLVQLDIAQEQAQLTQAEARRDLAKLNLDRNEGLLATRTISQSEFDQTSSDFRSAQASVDQIKATIAKKTIRAPFDGVTGIRKVNLGQYLRTGQPIVSLETMDPIYVNFELPQRELGTVAVGQQVEISTDAFLDQAFHGKVTAINSQFDNQSRNVQVQATVANPAKALRPGVFARVRVLIGNDQEVMTIPMSAVNYTPTGTTVYVVAEGKGKDGKPAKVVKLRPVQLGADRGDLVAVQSGLKAGEEIVTAGTFRLRNDSPIIVNNAVQPESKINPTPADS